VIKLAGLPKKYAKMGFKKGWAAYKKVRSKPKVKTITTRKNKVKVAKVAKKRRSNKKQNKKSGMEKVLNSAVNMLLPVGYGYVRDRMSDAVNNLLDKTGIGQKIPVTAVTDEAVMLGAAWGIGKLGVNKSPLGRKALGIIKIVEKARIGEELSNIQQNKKIKDVSLL